MQFIGRAKEMEWLRSLLSKKSASFVVVRGRRRIGKSRLIREFGNEVRCHMFSGLAPAERATRKSQLHEFCSQVAIEFQIPKFQVDGWGEAFAYLATLCATGQHVIALDEISWIGSKDADFLGHLKNAWDLHFSKNPQVIVIVCGSVSSWIEENILSSTGFVGRISVDICLEELSLSESAEFWDDRRDRVSPAEILKVLSITGGVPKYLEEVKPNLSAEANIKRLCFDKRGLLFHEFDRIFTDLFSSRVSKYIALVDALSSGSRTLKELSLMLKEPDSSLWEHLEHLVQAGFVSKDPSWDIRAMRKARLYKYRLCDNYVRFYLRYIRPYRDAIEEGTFNSRPLSSLPEWDSIIGLQFENIVVKNAVQLLPKIHLDRADLVRCGPFFQQTTKSRPGCQVDLLIQARYRTVFLCEVKFSVEKLGMSAVEQLLQAQKNLSLPRGWSSRLVLIHVNGVSSGVIQSNSLDHIIDFSELI